MKKKIDNDMPWQEASPGGMIFEAGNAAEFKTGDWRSERPVWLEDKCKQCSLCVPVCPDSSIPVDKETGKRTDFDFDHCKGCGVCAHACPFNAIAMEQE